jgi:hypothetical protein
MATSDTAGNQTPKTLLPEPTPEILKPAVLVVPAKKSKSVSPMSQLFKRVDNIEAKLATRSADQSNVQSPLNSVIASIPPAPNPHSHHADEPHYIGSWQQYCPTCGDRNPDFKDEVVCKDCGTHLGARATAEKLKACPNCGGQEAKAVK